MLAEALNEQGKTNLVLLEVQKVRTRANLITNMLLNQLDTRVLIKKEQILEQYRKGKNLLSRDFYVNRLSISLQDE